MMNWTSARSWEMRRLSTGKPRENPKKRSKFQMAERMSSCTGSSTHSGCRCWLCSCLYKPGFLQRQLKEAVRYTMKHISFLIDIYVELCSSTHIKIVKTFKYTNCKVMCKSFIVIQLLHSNMLMSKMMSMCYLSPHKMLNLNKRKHITEH